MAKITYLGHSGISVQTDGMTFLFDPWVEGNPDSPFGDISELGHADMIFVSHDHGDHGFSEAVKICKNSEAIFVAVGDLVREAERQGVEHTAHGNIGGSIEVDGVEIHFTQALHTSNIGVPCGFVVKTPGLTVYHAGDTGLFGDMKFIGEFYKIDVAFLPIGSCYTMGPREAAKAVELIQPRIVVPIHYQAFPLIQKDPNVFKNLVGSNAEVRILKPGESMQVT
jgi:L-ascorbate metabolism protein UlaG (beta-lactamase superfamily)